MSANTLPAGFSWTLSRGLKCLQCGAEYERDERLDTRTVVYIDHRGEREIRPEWFHDVLRPCLYCDMTPSEDKA